MKIIPAIDIINGQCVRLSQGDFKQKKTYATSPLEMAKIYEDNGFKFLHVVDLDGAQSGQVVNAKTLNDICVNTNLIVDFGGGIKSKTDLEKVFDAGASQVTLGSVAVKSPELVAEWIDSYGTEKLILGADVKNEMLSISGWTETVDLNVFDFVRQYQKLGMTKLISTDIAVDGMLSGPSIELYQKLMSQFPQMEVIASGGVGSIQDLDNLKKINVAGVIIGKAIYENKIDLKELAKYVN